MVGPLCSWWWRMNVSVLVGRGAHSSATWTPSSHTNAMYPKQSSPSNLLKRFWVFLLGYYGSWYEELVPSKVILCYQTGFWWVARGDRRIGNSARASSESYQGFGARSPRSQRKYWANEKQFVWNWEKMLCSAEVPERGLLSLPNQTSVRIPYIFSNLFRKYEFEWVLLNSS